MGLACALALLAPAAASAKRPPNIVLVMTDDQPDHTVQPAYMPNIHRLIYDRGAAFSNFIITTPLCCPSRATLLTGQYGHNNGVLENEYANLVQKRNVLPRWLKRAGYTTARVGKFMNGYDRFARTPLTPAPGWDRWFSQLAPRAYYGWQASRNGKRLRFGKRNRSHATVVTSRLATRWARSMAQRRKPFYLQVDYYAPHGAPGRDRRCHMGPVPAPRDEGKFDDVPLPGFPNFNPADVSDKPSVIRQLPRLTDDQIAQIHRRYRCTLESLLGVDRGVRSIHRAIRKQGEGRRTVFIFTSDNGYFFGEHRIRRKKDHPYEENLRMPLAIAAPKAYGGAASRGSRSNAPVANIDLAPTIMDLAGGRPCTPRGRCRIMDGRSLLPLVDGSGQLPRNRTLLIESGRCDFRGVRQSRQVYLEQGCEAAEAEHYDLVGDPYQLKNLAFNPRPADQMFQVQARTKMQRLLRCAGVAGRDPRTGSRPHCE